MMEIKKTRLRTMKSKIKFGRQSDLPFSQGWAINKVIKEYNIPAKRWGYSGDIIAVETNKQFIFWKDKGGHLEFQGLLNK